MTDSTKRFLIRIITWYQRTLSPDHGPHRRATCRFTPTCSDYGKDAIMKHGWKGLIMTVWRIVRCNPLITKAGTVDLVP